MSATSRAVRIAESTSSWIFKHKKVILLILFLGLCTKATAIAIRGKYGDFQPLVLAIDRLHHHLPLYVTGVTYPEYVYSPFLALVLSPLGYLPPALFRFLWFLLSLAASIGCIALCIRLLRFSPMLNSLIHSSYEQRTITSLQGKIVILTLFVSWYWILYNLLNGQINPIMLFITLTSINSVLQGKEIRGGALLAVATLAKPFPLIFLPLFFLLGKIKTCVATLITLGICTLIPWGYFTTEYHRTLSDWLAANIEQQTIYDIADAGHQSLFSTFARIAGMQSPSFFPLTSDNIVSLISLVIILISICIGLYTTWRLRHEPLYGMAVGCILWAITPPTSWKHYYITLLLPTIMIATHIVTHSERAKKCALLLIVFTISVILQYIPFFGEKGFVYLTSHYVWIALFMWNEIYRSYSRTPTRT